MGELIRGIETPKIPGASENASTQAYNESHAYGEFREAAEEEIAETRNFILEKYKIPKENIVIEPHKESSKKQRKIRAFSILSNTEVPESSFYGEGHLAHKLINDMLVEKFGGKIGITDFEQLVDDDTFEFKKPWAFKKGFLDPFHNGFREFPHIRRELLGQLRKNMEANTISEEEMQAIENGNQNLPNWFLSADSTRGF